MVIRAPTSTTEPALVRYARLKQQQQQQLPHAGAGPRTITSPPKPEKWSVKDTTVNIANAFTLAADHLDLELSTPLPHPPDLDNIDTHPNAMQNPATANPNTAWASSSRTTQNPTHIPRSTSVEYEKETQSTSTRRFAPPPNRLAPPPSRSNGTGRKQLAKQASLRQVPDSEGEGDDSREEGRPATNERGKSPFEHVVDMTRRALGPATFYLRQRSQEPPGDGIPNGHHGHSNSYDYSAEEREYQSQKPTPTRTPASASASGIGGTHHHKKGRMSLDNKAYRPSASDLDDSDESEDDDGRKVRRRKSKKKEPHGGPLTTLPTVAGHTGRKKKKRGSKGGMGEGEEEEEEWVSDEHEVRCSSLSFCEESFTDGCIGSILAHCASLRQTHA